MKAKTQAKILYTIAVLVGLASIYSLLYPWISDTWNDYVNSLMIVDYSKAVQTHEGETADYTEALAAAEKYNQELYEAGNNHISEYTARASGSEMADQLKGNVSFPDEYYESLLSFGEDGMMGYITIPKINVLLPIKHYTTSEVLASNVGHLYGSSLPVGGENTHAVLTGHSALMTAKLFTDLEKMEIGDKFSISVGDRKLNYEVDQINVVLPDEFDLLTIEEGQDLVTLITCTPYAVNTHRLLVRGHRIADDADMTVEKTVTEKAQEVLGMPVTMLCIVGAIFVCGLLIIVVIWRKKDKDEDEEETEVVV